MPRQNPLKRLRRPGSAKKSKRKTPRQRVIGVREGRVRAERLIKANRELFRRLAGTSRGELTCAELAVRSTIKRTIRDYRKTLRSLASGPGRTKRG